MASVDLLPPFSEGMLFEEPGELSDKASVSTVSGERPRSSEKGKLQNQRFETTNISQFVHAFPKISEL